MYTVRGGGCVLAYGERRERAMGAYRWVLHAYKTRLRDPDPGLLVFLSLKEEEITQHRREQEADNAIQRE
jgi:hypothetical protein